MEGTSRFVLSLHGNDSEAVKVCQDHRQEQYSINGSALTESGQNIWSPERESNDRLEKIALK
jgi:hypothetical protein